MKLIKGSDILALGEAMAGLKSCVDPEMIALRRDAARYRYLRDRMPRADAGQPVWLRTGDDLDEAVDAAMAEETPSQGTERKP